MILDFKKLKRKYNLKVSGVLHIGGHFGKEFSVYEANRISDVIFFEPVPSTFETLEKNLRGKAVLVKKALGSENKRVKMYGESANAGQSNSVLAPKLHLTQYPEIVFNETIEVEMIRLDDFLPEFYSEHSFAGAPPKYNFINIDVQGYELEVFRGSVKTLADIDYIMTEVNREEVYENCALVGELDDFLKTYGFKRVETLWEGHTWGDAFYIKGDIPEGSREKNRRTIFDKIFKRFI